MEFNKKNIENNKAIPPLGKVVKNFGKAIIKHAADGFKDVDMEEYQRRLQICNDCEEWRLEDRCTHPDCGCYLEEKAWWRSEKCPVGKWKNKEKRKEKGKE